MQIVMPMYIYTYVCIDNSSKTCTGLPLSKTIFMCIQECSEKLKYLIIEQKENNNSSKT